MSDGETELEDEAFVMRCSWLPMILRGCTTSWMVSMTSWVSKVLLKPCALCSAKTVGAKVEIELRNGGGGFGEDNRQGGGGRDSSMPHH